MDEKLSQYFALLAKWNEKIALISSARDEAEFRAKHVDDAMQLIALLSGCRRVLDLGTGAGIPGIIIKIAAPEIDVVLLDATRKKVSFCDEAIRQLKLEGIEAVCGRAEDPVVARQLGVFDAVVSRATWKIAEYIDKSIGYIATGGRILAMKGPSWQQEYREAETVLQKHGLKKSLVQDYELKDGERRSIVVLEK